jgi:glucose/arabinose dehydrogenase
MIAMENGLPGTQTVLYTGGRVRNVKQGPSGKIYVSVEDAGQLLELTAKP